MNQTTQDLLKIFAQKYIWWKTPDEALHMPNRIIAQVMSIGDYSDVQALVSQVGNKRLCKILKNAEAGQFSTRSWTYWHYRLDLSNIDEVPPLPVRRII